MIDQNKVAMPELVHNVYKMSRAELNKKDFSTLQVEDGKLFEDVLGLPVADIPWWNHKRWYEHVEGPTVPPLKKAYINDVLARWWEKNFKKVDGKWDVLEFPLHSFSTAGQNFKYMEGTQLFMCFVCEEEAFGGARRCESCNRCSLLGEKNQLAMPHCQVKSRGGYIGSYRVNIPVPQCDTCGFVCKAGDKGFA